MYLACGAARCTCNYRFGRRSRSLLRDEIGQNERRSLGVDVEGRWRIAGKIWLVLSWRVSISRGQREGGGVSLFAEVWAFWFLDTESERERTVKDNVARTSTATRRVGCCPRGTSRIRSFLGITPSTRRSPGTTYPLPSRLDALSYLTLLCPDNFPRSSFQGCRSTLE